MSIHESLTPPEFVNNVELFINSKLKRKIELLRIYETSIQYSKEKEFDNLLFSAKFVHGLFIFIQRDSSDNAKSDIENIKKELSAGIKKIIDQIQFLVKDSNEEFREYLNENFFIANQQNFLKLTELISDLAFAKLYVNDRKRNSN